MRHHLLLTSAMAVALIGGQAQAQTAPPGAGGSVAPAPDAAAGDDTGRLADIVVTAQKRAENIQKVPLSIFAVSGEALKTAGVNDPVSLQKLVPTLQINNTVFGAGVVIRIRGFGSAANTATDSEVASYLDGAYVPRPGALLGSFLDVKNIEVLNGPQGTLFGRNATLGAISINTNAPSTDKRTFDFTAEGASYGTYAATAVANLPVGDTFAVRLAVKGSRTNGVFKNQFDGGTYGERSGFVSRLSTKWEIAPQVNWTVRGDYTRSRGDGLFPQTVYTKTASAAQLTALNGFVTRNGGTALILSDRPSYTVNQVARDPYAHDRQYGVTSDLSWGVASAVTLRLINSYRDWHNKQKTADTVSTSLDLLAVRMDTKSKAQSHELQLVSAKDAFLGGKLGITAGLYYAREKYSLGTSFFVGSQFCQVILGRAPAAALAGCNAGPKDNGADALLAQVANSYAAYLQADYQLLPDVSLAVGVRETHDTKNGSFASVRPNPGLAAILTPEGPTALTFKDDNFSARGSLSWTVTERVLFFFTASTGYKSGGFNSGPSSTALTAARRTFASETVDDYELGAKTTLFDNRLRLNITGFHTTLHNFQDRSYDGNSFLIRNSGDVRSRGFDLDGALAAARNVKITFGTTYLDSIYKTNPTAPGLEGCTGLAGCPTVQNLAGKRLGFAPKWQGNVGAEFKTGEFAGGYTAAFGANEHFTSSFLTANTNNPQSRLPGYATTDLRLSIISPGGRFQLDIFGQNVFDKRYYVTTLAQTLGAVMGINDTATGATVFRGLLGDRARYGARISARF